MTLQPADPAKPRDSIVMPCHLGSEAQAALLDETLRTVTAQTRSDYEVFLIDDGSPVPPGDAADRVGSPHILWRHPA